MSNVVVAHPNTKNWKYHAERIAMAWNKQIPSIIETGRAVIDAREELEDESFKAMVQSKLPFVRQTAYKLINIAEHPIISSVAHVRHLPSSWGTLHELTKLPNDVLLAKLKDGSIHPKLERKDVKAMRPDAKPTPASRAELIAAIQKDPNANQRDAAAALGVSLGMYQRTRNELIGSGHIAQRDDPLPANPDELINKLVELLKTAPREQQKKMVTALRVGLGLSVREWMSTITIGKGSK